MRIEEKQKDLIIVMIATPAIVAPLMLLGVYAGSFLGIYGFPVVLMQSLLATAGFVGGIFLVGRVIVHLVNKKSRNQVS
jgi:small neutral amino acid transporter SnatA (MarC family)